MNLNPGLLSTLFAVALDLPKAQAVGALLHAALEAAVKPGLWAEYVVSRLPDTFTEADRKDAAALVTAAATLGLHVLERFLPGAAAPGGPAHDPDAPAAARDFATPADDEPQAGAGAAQAPQGSPDCR